MNLTQVIIVAAACILGFVAHKPLFGTKDVPSGALASMIWKKSAPVRVTPKKPDERPKLPNPNVPQNDELHNLGTSGGDIVKKDTEPKQGLQPDKNEKKPFAWEHIIKSDFPTTCKMLRDGFVVLDGQNIQLARGTEMEPISVEGINLTARVPSVGGGFVKIPIIFTDVHALTQDKYNKRVGIKTRGANTNLVKNTNPDPKKINNQESVSSSQNLNVKPPVQPKADPPKNLISDFALRNLVRKEYKKLNALKNTSSVNVSSGKNEQVGDKIYQVGVVRFNKSTLVGERKLTVKAFISDEEIKFWRWQDSEVEVE